MLVIGRGGREHAICQKAKKSPLVSQVFAAPGNVGMADAAALVPIQESDQRALIQFAKKHSVGLTIIGQRHSLEV